ncbi:MAG TPA: amino acid ABC transporter substrate-binding protein [Candidatus Elarobacter sp.]|jgi:branched-chain amino acid transport system substrate-binding protein|nr:amino acid ABC transporter substrate-binding protein [Candidatus Elarobacter sp.]
MRRAFLSRALAAGTCLALAAAAPLATRADNGPSEIVVGAALPLTGEESRIGAYYKDAYELETKEINDAGGIMLKAYGRKVPVKLIIYDDKTDAATSRNLYERLAVQDHVDAMLGGYATDLVQAQTVVPQQYKIPYVGGGGAATAIYKRGFTTIFSLLASIQNLAYSECDFIEEMQAQHKLPTPLKMAIVYENTSHGRDFEDGLQTRAKAKPKNYQIVMSEAFDLHGKDFTPLLQKVKGSGANAFMADAHLDDYITMARQYKQLGLHHAYITYGARGPEKAARDALGPGVDYIVAAAWWNQAMPSAGVRTFDDKWKAAYPQLNAEWYGALPYETARTLYTAFAQTGSLDKAKVTDTLRHIDLPSILPGGHIKFEADGQINAPFVVTENLPGGKTVIVYPHEEKTGDPVLPVPES